MRSCLFLIVILIASGVLLKTCVSKNPLRTALESAQVVAPVDLDYERRPWLLVFALGFREHLKFINKSSSGVRITSGQVVRKGGKSTPITDLPQILKPYESTEMKLMNGIANFVIKPGDKIEIYCEGYPMPSVIRFEE